MRLVARAFEYLDSTPSRFCVAIAIQSLLAFGCLAFLLVAVAKPG
jgi:hypothetical protein